MNQQATLITAPDTSAQSIKWLALAGQAIVGSTLTNSKPLAVFNVRDSLKPTCDSGLFGNHPDNTE